MGAGQGRFASSLPEGLGWAARDIYRNHRRSGASAREWLTLSWTGARSGPLQGDAVGVVILFVAVRALRTYLGRGFTVEMMGESLIFSGKPLFEKVLKFFDTFPWEFFVRFF